MFDRSKRALQQDAQNEAEHRERVERMIRQASDGKSEQRAEAAARNEIREERGGWFRRAQRHDEPAPYGPGGAWPVERPHGGRRRRMSWLARKLTGIAFVLLLLAAAYLFLWPRLQTALTPQIAVSLPDSLGGMLPDEKMGYTSLDFANAILGESREKKELIVMEQDVEVTSQITQDLLNISLFSKQKVIHSFGTGIYTVNLEALREGDVAYDEATGIITVTVPHAKLSRVSVDVEKTEFEDTRRALLAVGDIKLTPEQKHALDEAVDAALRERLNAPALFVKADEIALNQVRELFQTPISALSEELVVKIVMA